MYRDKRDIHQTDRETEKLRDRWALKAGRQKNRQLTNAAMHRKQLYSNHHTE